MPRPALAEAALGAVPVIGVRCGVVAVRPGGSRFDMHHQHSAANQQHSEEETESSTHNNHASDAGRLRHVVAGVTDRCLDGCLVGRSIGDDGDDSGRQVVSTLDTPATSRIAALTVPTQWPQVMPWTV